MTVPSHPPPTPTAADEHQHEPSKALPISFPVSNPPPTLSGTCRSSFEALRGGGGERSLETPDIPTLKVGRAPRVSCLLARLWKERSSIVVDTPPSWLLPCLCTCCSRPSSDALLMWTPSPQLCTRLDCPLSIMKRRKMNPLALEIEAQASRDRTLRRRHWGRLPYRPSPSNTARKATVEPPFGLRWP